MSCSAGSVSLNGSYRIYIFLDHMGIMQALYFGRERSLRLMSKQLTLSNLVLQPMYTETLCWGGYSDHSLTDYYTSCWYGSTLWKMVFLGKTVSVLKRLPEQGFS